MLNVARCRKLCFISVMNNYKVLSDSAKKITAVSNTHILNTNKNIYKIWVKDYTSGKHEIKCWKCGKTSDKPLFCSHCQSLQKPAKDMNYFQVLGLKESFKINETQLSKLYKDLQKNLHPDKFSNRDPTEQNISAEYSSLVNKAYSTLQQPLSRGLYMLRMRGVELTEETQMESSFLQEIMEKNEQVEEAETQEEVLALYKSIKDTLATQAEDLETALGQEDIARAKEIVIRMKYYTSIETQLKETIRRMGIVT